MKLPLIILGDGGHARVLIETLVQRDFNIIGITTPDKTNTENIYGIPIVGNDDMVLKYSANEIRLVNGIGSVNTPIARASLYHSFKEKGFQFQQVIHPTSIISPSALIAEGVQVMAGAIIQTESQIGANTIINTKASIDHDCKIGMNVHVAPGVTISGGVEIGNNVHIGTGAVIIQGIKIGDNCVIGAGSVVLNNVNRGNTVIGVPAKPKGGV
ncbi:acetyltransferase [Neobacillus sp. D3-1R]|uniref:acetyltransferase n=1 Tax=Neobacillus sp. D3-1R TaxID=3445778 RepID=UPI003FA0BDE6